MGASWHPVFGFEACPFGTGDKFNFHVPKFGDMTECAQSLLWAIVSPKSQYCIRCQLTCDSAGSLS